jgi:hypothetical protein
VPGIEPGPPDLLPITLPLDHRSGEGRMKYKKNNKEAGKTAREVGIVSFKS